ncbi:MAG: protein kinase UbiB [Elusimicrobia bacterium]|nr:protein kinase UbiB [Elusimicrobiota bacterium]
MNPSEVIDRVKRNSDRAGEIGAVMVKYGLADWLRKIPGERVKEWLTNDQGQPISDLTPHERIRLALTELGPTFIKLGQMLSTRADLVGQDLARELSSLQNQTPADSPRTAQSIIRKELGQSVDHLFAHFEPEPFASASIAQVHRARLHSGEKVVVKVQKNGIDEIIEADLSLLAELAALAEAHVSELKRVRPVALIAQFARTLRGELDFSRERRNLETFRENFAGDDTVRFPQSWADFSSPRVLTMERMNGILVSHPAKLKNHVSNIDEFARRGATVYLEMIFRDGFFHADPHPGNLMLLEEDRVGVLDCGMVQRLDDELHEKLVDVLLALHEADTEALTNAVWSLGSVPAQGSKQRLRPDLTEFLAQYRDQSINEVRLGQALTYMIEIIRRNDIVLPPAVSMLLRMLIELEGTAQLLNPRFSLMDLIQPYYKKALSRQFSPIQMTKRARSEARTWMQFMHRLPRDLSDMLERISAGTLSVPLDHRRLDPVVNRLVLAMVASSLFLGSSLLWSMKAPPLIRGVSLFGVIGYGLGILIGVRLFRRIQRSEKFDGGQR